MYSSVLFKSAAALAMVQSVAGKPTFEKVQEASITLDTAAFQTVPIPGGSRLATPVTDVTITALDDSLFNATCKGSAWTTTYDAGNADKQYTEVEVRLTCETDDGVPFQVQENGLGTVYSNALRTIKWEIGAPYEFLRSQFFVAEVETPLPDYRVGVYRYVR